jgi:hypothetical protein
VACIYGANTYVVKNFTENRFVHWYLNDVFAMPFMLAYSNMVVAALGRSDLSFSSLSRIVALTGACAFPWEVLTPLVVAKSVSDPYDFLAYLMGALFYYASGRRRARPN